MDCWIVRGREAVKHMVTRWVVCKNSEGKVLITPKVTLLPPSRVRVLLHLQTPELISPVRLLSQIDGETKRKRRAKHTHASGLVRLLE